MRPLQKSSSFAKTMRVERINISEGLPVTLEQLKEHLRITSNDFDNNLTLLLKAAVASAEKYTGQIFQPGSFRFAGNFQSRIKTGVMPITGITSAWIDGNDLEAGVVGIQDSVLCFPLDIHGKSVMVEFEAGFPVCPFDVAAAILLTAAKLFENPSDSVEQLPKASTNLLRPYKRWGR